MKKLIYIIVGAIFLGFLTRAIATGQTRQLYKELDVKVIKKEEKKKRISKKQINMAKYFEVKGIEAKTYYLEVSKDIFLKYEIDDICHLIIEKDIFNEEHYEISEDYDKRQISISDSTNVWIGRFFVLFIGLAWLGFIWYFVHTVRSFILNRKAT
jgi:hypothetical protein